MLCRAPAFAAGLGVLGSLAACSSPSVHFSEANARAHLNMLAGTIGSRPVGTDANRRAREYLIEQLRLYGFDVRVQEIDARRPEVGLTARVSNIIATKAGDRPDAIALVAHYDSVPESPGATDDGLGTAVCLEAGRLLAARPQATYSLMILLTDGEEPGLLGAAGLVTDRAVTNRVRAYLNIESIGSDGPSLLFETGPGNDWLVKTWARHAPRPRGSSYATEIYRRLPNDTDFSVLKRAGWPGLNFAPTGDSYAYHTARDTPDRLASRTIRQTGETIVALVDALDRQDLSQRTATDPVFFDVASATGVAYGPGARKALAALAFFVGLAAWIRLLRAARRIAGLAPLLITAAWAVVGTVAVGTAVLGTAWALRAVRESYHPWYAHPDRFFALLVSAGAGAGWAVVRIGARLPRRLRACGDPALVWSWALPVWLALAALAEWRAPAAAYLWTLPLLAAAVLLAGTPLDRPEAVRIASVLALAVASTLWLRDTLDFSRFAVCVFGRLAFITPIAVYPAVLLGAGLMLAPPLIALVASREPRLRRPPLATAALLALLATTAGLAYAAPAYTFERPLRREVRYVHDKASGQAQWEVGGSEPGLDLEPGQATPTGWQPVSDAPAASLPLGALGGPFVFRARAEPFEPPASVAAVLRPRGEEAELEISVLPAEPGATVVFVMPPGLVPRAANLPGRVGDGNHWRAAYVAPPREGIAFRATVGTTEIARLGSAAVVIGAAALPGGVGWQRLPPWLPQDRMVWRGQAVYILPLSLSMSPPRPVNSTQSR